MKNYINAVQNEKLKFLNWKKILFLICLVVIIACCVFPCFKYTGNETGTLQIIKKEIATEKDIENYQNALNYLNSDEYFEDKILFKDKDLLEKNRIVQINKYKYLMENNIVYTTQEYFPDINIFLDNIKRFSIILLYLTITFSVSVFAKEYRKKNITQIKILPIKNSELVFAKLTILLEYVTIINIVYFGINACFLTQFEGCQEVFACFYNGRIAIYNRYLYLFLMSLIEWVSCFALGCFTLMVTNLEHNGIFICGILYTLIFLLFAFYLRNQEIAYRWLTFAPFYDTPIFDIFSCDSVIIVGCMEWWIQVVQQLIVIAICIPINCLIYKKQQVKL